MKYQNSNFTALGLFALLTLLMSYPTVFKMGSSVRDYGDPLLNTWIMSWNTQKIIQFDFDDYFDANIFYPHQRTLAYSEHLFTQSLVFLPAFLLSKNPLWAYNFVLLFSFLTSGFGMFLLARYLTSSFIGAIVAGIIYAFSPFMFSHLGHIQIITAGGIPLTFLFLHQFFKHEHVKHLLLFTFFYILQVLANGYYALYLTLFIGLYILFYIITKNKFRDWRFWIKISGCVVLVLAAAGPFFRQYILVRQEMGFVRGIQFSTGITSFLAAPPINRIYGPLTLPLVKPERVLFPGICALALALLGIAVLVRRKERGEPLVEKPVVIYSIILVLSFLFTFGAKGPYWLLYKYVPGFDGLRATARFHVFVMFSLAVFSAFGIKALFDSVRDRKKALFLGLLLTSLTLVEYLSIPVPLKRVPVKDEIPEVYKWLAQEKGDLAILELPLPQPKESSSEEEFFRPYYSTYHWKRIVNGRSGYFPPLYKELKRRWYDHPVEQNLEDLKKLKVNYLIVHSTSYDEDDLANLLADFSQSGQDIHLKNRIGEAFVYELLYHDEEKLRLIPADRLQSISGRGWKVRSNVKQRQTQYAVDQDLSTCWRSGPEKTDVFFELDLGRVHLIKGISFRLDKKGLDYPRSYRLEVSQDGLLWGMVAEEETYTLPITAFLKPQNLSFDIIFPQREVRYIKIINTEEMRKSRWTIYEIEVFE